MYTATALYTAAVFEGAASKGDPEAVWSYAICILFGEEHTARNPALAQQWFERAIVALTPLAAAGDAKAQYRLGTCAVSGWGCESDKVAGAQWRNKAVPGLQVLAEGGDTKAASYLGTCCSSLGDEVGARYWKERAAQQGHAPAHLYLAMLHKDPTQAAVHWLEVARGGMLSGIVKLRESPTLQLEVLVIEANEACGVHREQLGAWVPMATGLLGEVIPTAPTAEWVSDTTSKSCLQCKAAFTLILRRRHHCRACGLLICTKCTTTHPALTKVCTPCGKILNQYCRLQRKVAGEGGAVALAIPKQERRSGRQSLTAGFCAECGKAKLGVDCQECGAAEYDQHTSPFTPTSLQLMAATEMKLGTLIGSGNFGKVYEGTVGRGVPVACAIKVPNADAGTDFQQELEICQRLTALGGTLHHRWGCGGICCHQYVRVCAYVCIDL
jgi:hypothetical protein